MAFFDNLGFVDSVAPSTGGAEETKEIIHRNVPSVETPNKEERHVIFGE